MSTLAIVCAILAVYYTLPAARDSATRGLSVVLATVAVVVAAIEAWP